MRITAAGIVTVLFQAGTAPLPGPAPSNVARAAGETAPLRNLEAAVAAAERVFAGTMADRDHVAFAAHVSEEAVFVGREVLRGRAAVVAGWKRYFEGTQAPFSWEPDRVVVLASGKLGLSSGPVRDPSGKRVGTFTSTWRLEDDGRWRVIFDHGCPPCDCAAQATSPPAP